MYTTVTVAIPVRNGARTLGRVLAAVQSQQLRSGSTLELAVCDSGSSDGSAEVAVSYGAKLIRIRPDEFSHGATRNLLMERSNGEHVAFLTQDAIPASSSWLNSLLDGFELASDVAMVFGPYVPNPGASPMIARELSEWFGRLSPGGEPRIDRLAEAERDTPPRALLGPRGFFTDANGAIARSAWKAVPFRTIGYAEDHALAHDMLRAGYAKVYMPTAPVLHSHDYSVRTWFRRSFDEARALHELYGYVEPMEPRAVALKLWGLISADWRWMRRESAEHRLALLPRSAAHHAGRIAGAALGSRAARVPAPLVRRLSLEARL